MKIHYNCILCNSIKLTDLADYSKAHLCKCQNCGFIFSRRIPSEEEINNYYSGYSVNNFISRITILRYNELLDHFERYRKNNKILDVGCGSGYFLEEAKKRGWEVYGTEFSDQLIQICCKKGISMQKGVLNVANYASEMFDVITSFEVIEHINNPKTELSNFYAILRKGGLVYATTPNFNSLLRYRLKHKYNIITYPEHLSYYTPKTFQSIFELSGFKKDKIISTGISLTRLNTSNGKSKEPIISAKSSDEKIRARIENEWHLKFFKQTVNNILTFAGKGDGLKGWFIKK